jgi:hypothetical protein
LSCVHPFKCNHCRQKSEQEMAHVPEASAVRLGV